MSGRREVHIFKTNGHVGGAVFATLLMRLVRNHCVYSNYCIFLKFTILYRNQGQIGLATYNPSFTVVTSYTLIIRVKYEYPLTPFLKEWGTEYSCCTPMFLTSEASLFVQLYALSVPRCLEQKWTVPQY